MTNIVIVGEAYGEKEEEAQAPFVGTSGWLLDGMLSQIGIARRECFLTNVFNIRPKPNNDIKNLCGTRAEGIPGMPMLQKGKFAKKQYAQELDRLYAEIIHHQPNVIVALGATAAWALLRSTGIAAIRGAVAECTVAGKTFKVLPTYHPAAVARQWNLRPVVLSDLDKAKRESEFPELRRPVRGVWVRPTIEDLHEYEKRYIIPAQALSADIETAGEQITCIGFAPSNDSAIVIPFHSHTAPGKNYWDRADERTAWSFVHRWLAMKPSIFQNGVYDIQFLWRKYGIPVPLAMEDTMLMHHAWQPEMQKGLGFLATLYSDEVSWKFMRKGRKHD